MDALELDDGLVELLGDILALIELEGLVELLGDIEELSELLGLVLDDGLIELLELEGDIDELSELDGLIEGLTELDRDCEEDELDDGLVDAEGL